MTNDDSDLPKLAVTRSESTVITMKLRRVSPTAKGNERTKDGQKEREMKEKTSPHGEKYSYKLTRTGNEVEEGVGEVVEGEEQEQEEILN